MMKHLGLLSLIMIFMINIIEAHDLIFSDKQSIEHPNIKKQIESVNDMIETFYGKTVYVYIPRIQNQTTSVELPNDISMMVRSQFNSIGNNLYLLSQINLNHLPAEDVFIIGGAITAFDPNGESIEQGLQISGEGQKAGEMLSISLKDNMRTKITKLGITFNPSSAKTGNYISRTSVSNTIEVRNRSDNDKSSYSIFGVKIDMTENQLKSDGIHHSLRKLVQISTIEVLGRLLNYPYWLLTQTEPDEDILNYLSQNFIHDTIPKKIFKISYLLHLQNNAIEVTSIFTNRLKRAIIAYKREHALTPNETISKRFYQSLLGKK